MHKKGLAALGAVLMLAGCQTNYTYKRIGPGPTLEYANARCDMLASGVDQGYVAFGSSSYVAGAAIGNALGNAIREDRFMKNCMVLQGWKRVPVSSNNHLSAQGRQAQKRAAYASAHKTGKFPPAPKN